MGRQNWPLGNEHLTNISFGEGSGNQLPAPNWTYSLRPAEELAAWVPEGQIQTDLVGIDSELWEPSGKSLASKNSAFSGVPVQVSLMLGN